MLSLKLDSLLTHLCQKKFDAKMHEATNQILVLLEGDLGKHFPLFLKIFAEKNLLQLIVFLPCQILPNRIADLARYLHSLNKDLDIPGFGMDESAKIVFYRLMLPTAKASIDENLLENFLIAIKLICKTIAPSVIAMANRSTPIKI